MDDASFREILRFFDRSWRGYRKVRRGVKRRLAQHMRDCGRTTTEEYLGFLRKDPDAAMKARELLTISISRFFRDRDLWAVLEGWGVPKLIRTAFVEGGRPVGVWSAGSACGEECFSFLILWDQAGKRHPLMPRLNLWATDMNREVLERARRGVYPPGSLRGVSSEILTEYFHRVPQGFSISGNLKRRVQWAHHDFEREEPLEAPYDLVFLRNNLLTYFERTVQEAVLCQIVRGLRMGGLLIVGNNESPPLLDGVLRPCPEYRCIFERQR
jgi:chemotaxis methyl-accepting protein methylase